MACNDLPAPVVLSLMLRNDAAWSMFDVWGHQVASDAPRINPWAAWTFCSQLVCVFVEIRGASSSALQLVADHQLGRDERLLVAVHQENGVATRDESDDDEFGASKCSHSGPIT